jgi:hypothetical protein
LCLYSIFFLFGLFELLYGGLGLLQVGLFGSIPGSGLAPAFPLTIGIVFGVGAFYLIVRTLRTGSLMSKVVAVASAHEKIGMDDISRESGVKPTKVKGLVYEAIAAGLLRGSVKEQMFIRSETRPDQKVTVEREVLVSRKIPDRCPKCGASMNPKDVEWLGPDQVRCSHCGTTVSVSTERI